MDLELDDDLYKAVILEHYAHPPYRGRLENPTHYDEGFNPACGDEVELFLKIGDDRIEAVTFEGVGCSICLASASMLTQLLRGMTVGEATAFQEAFKDWLTDREARECRVDLQDLEAFVGVRRYPVRIKCALLAWETFRGALKQGDVGGGPDPSSSTTDHLLPH